MALPSFFPPPFSLSFSLSSSFPPSLVPVLLLSLFLSFYAGVACLLTSVLRCWTPLPTHPPDVSRGHRPLPDLPPRLHIPTADFGLTGPPGAPHGPQIFYSPSLPPSPSCQYFQFRKGHPCSANRHTSHHRTSSALRSGPILLHSCRAASPGLRRPSSPPQAPRISLHTRIHWWIREISLQNSLLS